MRAFFFLICVALTSAFPKPTIFMVDNEDTSNDPNEMVLSEECLLEMALAYEKRFWVPITQSQNKKAILNKLMQTFDFSKCKDVPIYINIKPGKPKPNIKYENFNIDDSDKNYYNNENSANTDDSDRNDGNIDIDEE